MSRIKIADFAFVRFRLPNLKELRDFVEDFGLLVTEADDQQIASRTIAVAAKDAMSSSLAPQAASAPA